MNSIFLKKGPLTSLKIGGVVRKQCNQKNRKMQCNDHHRFLPAKINLACIVKNKLI